MAGHSQYANIKHRKDAQDKKRSKLFTRCSRLIEVAARSGSPDPEMNSKLRFAITMARKISMPKDRIAQAIAKGSNTAGGDNYDEVRYEFRHSASGACCVISALTDNRNRTSSDIRSTLTKHGCTLANPGGMLYMFDNVGEIVFRNPKNRDHLMEAAIENGALHIEDTEEDVYIYTTLTDFDKITKALEEGHGDSDADSRLMWLPKEYIDIPPDAAEKLTTLISALEDLDDVAHIDTNCRI